MKASLLALLDKAAAPSDPLDALRPAHEHQSWRKRPGTVEILKSATDDLCEVQDALDDLASELGELEEPDEALIARIQRLSKDIGADVAIVQEQGSLLEDALA